MHSGKCPKKYGNIAEKFFRGAVYDLSRQSPFLRFWEKIRKIYIWGDTFTFPGCYIDVNGEEILKKARFAKVYETYAPMVYRRCFALLIFAGMDRLNLDSPSSLLWNTATRLCLNRIRDKKRRGLDVDSSELLLTIACASDEQDGYEARGVLARLFSKEPESSRTMAVLHFVDGMTLEETADAVGLSVSGVRKRLRGLQAKIRDLEVK